MPRENCGKKPGLFGGIACAAAIGTVGPAASPAYAIDKVTCRNGAGYTEIHNETVHCFANAGHLTVYISDVHKINSGNNRVFVSWYRLDGGSGGETVEKWQTRHYSPRVIVKRIQIF
ncbi:beta/gamma crystallin domain-containing protein [Spongiactinospora sp. TRM90649]|uniref:beta/gamma crystallin domain-containing protein n=1 Tax=Spongiactinospora sp. TRM90649 TaxID=3031114 RepID=UPI0023F8E111|nr:beta/gamma crystallin domain-containing protein [Spongiactinospora sp. TRM90649]MDF5753852.1 beta/gamma crystallin domain-containing protein [Spongiactinospora sp. TRM90649]